MPAENDGLWIRIPAAENRVACPKLGGRILRRVIQFGGRDYLRLEERGQAQQREQQMMFMMAMTWLKAQDAC